MVPVRNLAFVNPSNAKAKHKGAKIFEKQLNPVMLVFIGWLLPSTRVSVIFKGFLHHCVLAKSATTSIRDKIKDLVRLIIMRFFFFNLKVMHIPFFV